MDEDKLRALEDALDDMSRGAFNAAETLDDLATAGDKNLTYLEKSEKAWNEYFRNKPLARMAKDTAKFTGQLGKSFLDSGLAARENRESFDALKPVISAVGAAFKAIPIAGAGLSEAFTGVANFVVDEVNKTVSAYQTLGNVGATTAGGMSAMRDQAIQAGLSFQQFSEITKNNSESLAFFGGSTARGMQELARVTEAAKPLQTEFLNLGIGISEQSEVFAEYLGMSQRLGRNQQGDYNAQAESARRYIMQLDELARITGKTRDEAQKDLDAQLSNTRFRATLMQMEAEGRTTEAENLRQYVAGLPKDMQQGAMDLVGGAATEAGRAVEIALGGEGSQIFAGLKSGAIDANEGLARAQEAAQATIERVGLEYFARAGGLGGPLDSTAISLMDLAKNTALSRDELAKTVQEQKGARQTQDEATKNVIEAQQSIQQFAIEMDKFIDKNVFPAATEAVKGLSSSLADLAKFINKTIGGEEEPGWWDKLTGFFSGSNAMPTEAVELDFAAADGADVKKGQMGLVGEEGPELFMPKNDGSIIPNDYINADLDQKLALLQKNEGLSHEDYVKQLFEPLAAKSFPADETKNVMESIKQSQATVNKLIPELTRIVEAGIDQYPSVELADGSNFGSKKTGKFFMDFADVMWNYSGAQGKTGYNADGRWITHQLPSLVEGLSRFIFPDGRKQISYSMGGFTLRGMLDRANKIMNSTLSSSFGGGTASLFTDYLARTKDYTVDQLWGLTDGNVTFEKTMRESFLKGGIASGPKSGYSATLHGTEAVVPLPDGKSIPVSNASNTANDGKLVALMENMNTTLQRIASSTATGVDTSKQILRATAS